MSIDFFDGNDDIQIKADESKEKQRKRTFNGLCASEWAELSSDDAIRSSDSTTDRNNSTCSTLTTYKIEFARIIRTSCDDGPGIRSVLFLQGCSKRCPDCHNAGISRRGEGTLIPVEELAELITEQCKNRRLTISGGEPLEQLLPLRVLLKELKNRRFDLCLYTGWELNQVPNEILALLDHIKVGGFQRALSYEPLRFVGSSNQQMYRLRDGKIVSTYQLKETN